jgi:16S rRNA processing protein RimM
LQCVRADETSAIRLRDVRSHRRRLLLRIEGVDDAAAAAAYAGAVLYAPRDRLTLVEGEYLDEDLIGCAVEGKDGRRYGTVERVEHYPSSDMLVIGDRMVPMVAAIVSEIDLAAQRIVVDPPAGLLE